MDPISVLALVETCAGLAVTAGKLAIGLRTLADSYSLAALTFRSLSSQCRLFSCSVRAIQQWLEDNSTRILLDQIIQEQLLDSLECANDAIYALQDELTTTSKGSVNTFWEKLNVLWNQQNLKQLEDCIHKQISSLAIILQIVNLPSVQEQKKQLSEKALVFQDSRASTMSICNSGGSTKRTTNTTSTIQALSISTRLSNLPSFDFEDVLMSSQVYLRNRNQTLALKTSVSVRPKTRDAGTLVSSEELGLVRSEVHNPLLEQPGLKLYEKAWLFSYRFLAAEYEVLSNKYGKVKEEINDYRSQLEILKMATHPSLSTQDLVELAQEFRRIQKGEKTRQLQVMDAFQTAVSQGYD